MVDWVLDASAALALMRRESGADQVARVIADAAISAVNAAEVVTRLVREGMAPAEARTAMVKLDCQILSIDADLGLNAGSLSALTASKGLSLGDRCCLALAEREGAPALTTDRAWAGLALPIKVVLIR